MTCTYECFINFISGASPAGRVTSDDAENKELIFNLLFVSFSRIKVNFAEASRVALSFQTKLVSLLCFCVGHWCILV